MLRTLPFLWLPLVTDELLLLLPLLSYVLLLLDVIDTVPLYVEAVPPNLDPDKVELTTEEPPFLPNDLSVLIVGNSKGGWPEIDEKHKYKKKHNTHQMWFMKNIWQVVHMSMVVSIHNVPGKGPVGSEKNL